MAQQFAGYLLLALYLVEASSGLQHLKPGDNVTMQCPFTRQSNSLIRIFQDRQRIQIFSGAAIIDKTYIFNETEIEPSLTRLSSHLSVERSESGMLSLTIKDLSYGDSGKWGCDRISQGVTAHYTMDEILVEGPMYDLYWTLDGKELGHPLPDGADVFSPDLHRGSDIYCVVEVSNIEPKMELSIGPFGKEGSKTVTNWQDDTPFTGIVMAAGGTESLYKTNTSVRFQLYLNWRDFSRRQPLYLRASTPSLTLEKSIRPRKKESPPKGMRCSPLKHYTRPGKKDVQITCEFYLYPIPNGEWRLGNGERVSANAPIDGYSVEDKVTDAGYFSSSLTIADVTDADFGKLTLNLTNELGSGNMEVILVDGDEPTSQSGRSTTSLHLLLSLLLLPLINLLLPAI